MSASGDNSVLATIVRAFVLYGAAIAADSGRRFVATAIGYLIAAGLFVVSLGFLTSSGYAAISQSLGEVYASLIVGCIYLVAGLVAMLIVQFRRR